MNEPLWPLTRREQNLEEGIDQIGPEHIASYAYPEGRIWRYKEEGWRRALRRGIAVINVRDFGAVPDTAGK